MYIPQAIQALTTEQRRALLQWITQEGPFWHDVRNHSGSEWLEWNNEIVTDMAIGEAGWCCLNGIDRALVSITPSNWTFSPVPVVWMRDALNSERVEVCNYWQASTLEIALRAAPLPLATWRQVKEVAIARFTNLSFTNDSFEPLSGHPFVASAAQRMIVLLGILNRFRGCFNPDGGRTREGHEIYEEYFTGKKGNGGRGAIFSDSSDTEKADFRSELTFADPNGEGTPLFCPMHGKIQTPQMRIHFSWPIRSDQALYIVYVGPKITKR